MTDEDAKQFKERKMNEQERKIWNDAIDAVLELLRIHPPHRIGEAFFMKRLVALKEKAEKK